MIKINKFIINVLFIFIFLLPVFIFAGAPRIISVTIDPANPSYPGFCNPVRITVTACVNKYTNSYIAIAFSKYSTRQTIATPGQVFVVSYNGVSVGTETINPGSEIGYLFSAANASAPNDCTDCGGDTSSRTVTQVYEVYFPDPRYFFNYSTPCDFYLHIGMKDSYLGINDWVGLTTCQSYTTSFTFDSAYLYYDPTYTDIVAPATVNVGQVFTVIASVTNIGGGTSFNTTIDPLSYFGLGSVSFVARSGPTYVTLTSGTSNTFTFVYRADTSGDVNFIGNAKGLDSTTGNTIQAQTSCTYINCGGCIATNFVNIQTPATLQASINAYPIPVPLGSPFTVVMSVTNTGQALARNVTPSALIKLGPGNCSLISGPSPASADIFGGAAAYFTWTYSATGVSSVGFNANSSGYDGNTGELITSNNATSNLVFIYVNTTTPTLTLTPTATQTRTPAPTYVTTVGPANYPFPIDCDYANGIRITSYNSQDLLNMYNYWKSLYVLTASPGKRVRYTEPINGVYNRTLSEGQAYGMLLAVYFNDQALFNDLWAFKVARSSGKTSQLMPWIIENNGTTIVDQNSAPEADFDIAFALLMAHYQWGSGGTYNYQTLADTEITRCRQYDINADYSVRPGDAWNDWAYPSYYFPAFFRVFGEFQGGANQTTWNSVVAKCLSNINTNRNTSSGLVGEICDVSTGARRSDNPCSGGCDGTLYKYNSCRVPWRYATDWLWYGNATNSSGGEVSLLASFWNGRAATDVRDGYRINDNSVEGSVNNACFVGPAGCSLMYSSTYQTRLTEYYNRTNSFDVNESYYNGSLQVLTLLLMTGNFHNLRSFGSPEPTRTYTPVPSGQTIDCFEDGNVNNFYNDWGGEWFTYADRSTCNLTATVWPAPNTGVTPTAGGPTGSTYYLRVTGTKAAADTARNCYPSVGFGTDLAYRISQTGGAVDLRPFYNANGGIRFWARGNGSTVYKMTLVPRGAGSTIHKDWAMYEYQFTPPSSWTQIAIPFSSFTQPTWSTELYAITAVLQIMQKIQIQNGTNDAITFDFSIDCLELFPYLWTPTPIISPTSTRTPSPAGTSTFTRTRTPTASPTYTPTPTRTNTSATTPTFTPSRTVTPTYSRTASPTLSRTPTGTNTSVNTPTFTPSRTATPTYTRTITPTFTRTNTPYQSPTYTATGIPPTSTNTPSRTATNTPSPYQSPTYTATGIPPTSTNTPSRTATLVNTATRTNTPYQSPTYTATGIPPTSTNTPSRTASPTSSRTPTETNTTIPSNTSTPTRTPTPTFTVTDTISSNTPTNTPTHTPTLTITLTPTQTFTGTSTSTFTYTNTPVNTSTFTRTVTPPATNTYTPTFTRTPTSTFTPTGTYTQTPVATSTNTPAPTSEILEVIIVKPYPNPYNPEKDGDLRIGCKITQTDFDNLVIRIYTAGYRLIKEITPNNITEIASQEYIMDINASNLKALSNATYYYYIAVTKNNSEKKSKIDKLIILK